MRATLLALAAASLTFIAHTTQAAVPVGPIGPTAVSHDVTAGIWAGVCYEGPNNEYRCRYTAVHETTDVFDGSRQTQVDYTIIRSGENLWGYRSLSCVIDPKALTVTPNRATFNADVPDPMVASCSQSGWLCVDGECGEWYFTERVVIKGLMTDPTYQQSHVTMQTSRDNQAGTSIRQQCHGGDASGILGGGVSFSTTGGGELYFPFGSPGTYGQADGSYQYNTCSLIGQ